MKRKGRYFFHSIFLVSLIILSLNLFSIKVYSWEIDRTGTVYNIVDGDTIDVTSVGRIRLADIDCPEPGEPGSDSATQYISSLVYNKEVYVDVDDVYGTDIYGRTVAVIYVYYDESHLKNVNKAMVSSGHAVIDNYNNEFNPYSWTLYVEYPPSPPPPDPPPDDPDDPSPSSPSSFDNVPVFIAIAVGTGGITIAAYVLSAYYKTKQKKTRTPVKSKINTPMRLKTQNKVNVTPSFSKSLIKDITPKMSHITISGKVESVHQVREFTRKDGSKGRVGSFLLSDSSGSIRVVLWDANCSILDQGFLTVGKHVEITQGYSKINDFYTPSKIEIHLGRYSRVKFS